MSKNKAKYIFVFGGVLSGLGKGVGFLALGRGGEGGRPVRYNHIKGGNWAVTKQLGSPRCVEARRRVHENTIHNLLIGLGVQPKPREPAVG